MVGSVSDCDTRVMDPRYPRVLAIVNPVSGQHDPDVTEQKLRDALAAAGSALELRRTEGEGDAFRWAQDAADEGFDLVIASGGDGTIMEAMSGLMKSGCRIPLAQIPVGTASLLARALTIPTEIEKAIEVALAGKPVRLDVGYLPKWDRYFALMAGSGWDAKLIEDAPRELKSRFGFGAYLYSGIKNLFDLRNSHVTIEIDGVRHVRRAHTVMIANVGRLGGGDVAIGPDIWPHDGRLDAVIVSAHDMLGLLRLAFRFATRQLQNYRDVTYVQAERIAIDARPPLPVEIDGEPIGETPFEAEVVPDGALVIVPDDYRLERPTGADS